MKNIMSVEAGDFFKRHKKTIVVSLAGFFTIDRFNGRPGLRIGDDYYQR